MAVSTTPFKATGTKFGYKLTSGAASYTDVAEVQELTPPAIATAAINTSTLASAWKTAIPGTPDGGEVSVTLQYIPGDADFVAFAALATAPAMAWFQIMVPDGSSASTGSTVTFAGFLTGFAPGGFSEDSAPTVEVSIKVSGAVTFTAGT